MTKRRETGLNQAVSTHTKKKRVQTWASEVTTQISLLFFCSSDDLITAQRARSVCKVMPELTEWLRTENTCIFLPGNNWISSQTTQIHYHTSETSLSLHCITSLKQLDYFTNFTNTSPRLRNLSLSLHNLFFFQLVL